MVRRDRDPQILFPNLAQNLPKMVGDPSWDA